MTKIAVIHYSSTGNVAALARAAASALEKDGAEVRLRRVPPPADDAVFPGTEDAVAALAESSADIPSATLDDLDWADGALFGTPVRYGMPAHGLLRFIDTTTDLAHMQHRLHSKAVSAFASGSAAHGGQVTAILALHQAFCHWGSVIVPTGATDPAHYLPHNGNPYGSANISRNVPGTIHPENFTAVEAQARRLHEVATALVAGRATA